MWQFGKRPPPFRQWHFVNSSLERHMLFEWPLNSQVNSVIFASSKLQIIFGKLNSLSFANFQTRLVKKISKILLFRMALV